MDAALGWDAWLTLGVIVAMVALLVREVARPDLLLLGALGVLLAAGVLPPEAAFAGFSNSAVLAVGALFIVAAGVQSTGALGFADRWLFPETRSVPKAVGRLALITGSLSALLNNTPVVAMLIPRVKAWASEHDVPASKLMIPLSYAAILGGMTTLIGTSTNLLVSGMMEASGGTGLGMFDFAAVGLPAMALGVLYLTTVGHRLLPDRRREQTVFEDGLRDCLFEARVREGSPLAGRTVEEADLRALGDAFLAHIHRDERTIAAGPDLVLREGDVLGFVGRPEVLEALLARPGLERMVESLDGPAESSLPLYEAVVAPTSVLVGRSLRDAGFRERFDGVVLGIQRRDEAISGPLGRVPLQPGDLLLIEAGGDFDRRWNADREDFYLVASRRPSRPRIQPGRAPLAAAVLLAVVVLNAVGVAAIETTAFLGALVLLATGCLGPGEARGAVDIPVLLVIVAALGIGRAIELTGLADAGASLLIGAAAPLGPIGVLAAVYVATSLLTELVTNNAAAALMVGVGLSAARDLGLPPEAFGLAVAIAASASFLTPLGYQTNLMVMSAGSYRFSDYLRTGLAVNLLVAAIAIAVIWLVWL